MSTVYIARQPIFNSHKKIFGYELLFRDEPVNFVKTIDGDMATSELISNTLLIDDIANYTGGKMAFINFAKSPLVNLIPLMFHPSQITVEVLEDIKPDQQVVDACRKIVSKGFTLALDDYSFEPHSDPLVPIADMIKVDLSLIDIGKEQGRISRLIKQGKVLLAEKVESYSEYESALAAGFEFFQGHFFATPEMIETKPLPTSRVNLLNLMTVIARQELDYDELDQFISRDVTISYKLLRYINSAFYKTIHEIESIRQAIVFLGENEIRRFIALIAMAKLADDKPDELIRVSAVRARFCELIANQFNFSAGAQEFFTVGLFSLIDAIMDNTMEQILKNLPLGTPIKEALLQTDGELTDCLQLAMAYEKGNWNDAGALARKLDIDEGVLPRYYLEALTWELNFSRL